VYYYDAINITVPLLGNYTLTSISEFDSYGYLYVNNFDPLNMSNNLLEENDDANVNNEQFQITYTLQPAMTYILVVSTYMPGVLGPFSIMALGPASVTYSDTTDIATTLCEYMNDLIEIHKRASTDNVDSGSNPRILKGLHDSLCFLPKYS
jgi:hypothetical protein